MRTANQIRKDLKKVQDEAHEREADEKATQAEKRKATKALEAQLEQTKTPFRLKLNALDRKATTLYDKRCKLEGELEKAEQHQVMSQATEKQAFDKESIKAYLNYHGLHTHDLTFKKELPNKVKVFRDYDSERSLAYWFTLKGKAIGYWSKQASEHAGDDHRSFFFIGTKHIRPRTEVADHWDRLAIKGTKYEGNENDYLIEFKKWREMGHPFAREVSPKYGGYSDYTNTRRDSTAHQAIKYAGELDPKKLKSIDFTDKLNIQYIQYLDNHDGLPSKEHITHLIKKRGWGW